MSDNHTKFRLSLAHAFYCPVRQNIREERQPEVSEVQEALRRLEISVEPKTGKRLVEIVTSHPEDAILSAVGKVYSVYRVPPERPLANVAPTDFMP